MCCLRLLCAGWLSGWLTAVSGKTRVEATYLAQPTVYLESIGFDKYHFSFKVLHSLLSQYVSAHPPASSSAAAPSAATSDESAFLSAVRAHFEQERVPGWCRYVLGCLTVFCVRKRWLPGCPPPSSSSPPQSAPPAAVGLRFIVRSEVNASMGVSSSAAIEIATLRAVASLAQHTSLLLTQAASDSLTFPGTSLAVLGQLAENRIVGAPCGLMDQLSVAFGRPLSLLPILCRPDVLYDNIPLPDGVAVVGWPSGIKHSVGESPYAMARAGAFMGKRIMETLVGVKVGFTAEFTPSTLLAPPVPLPTQHQLATTAPASTASASSAHSAPAAHGSSPYVSRLSLLPISMLGADFLRQYSGVDDPLSAIKAELYYPVRDAFNFPIQENFRCQLVASLLSSLAAASAPAAANQSSSASSRSPVLHQIGELLYQSHRGYSAMGLGCPETDSIVSILQSMAGDGVYGGRISGGGSGGTVVVLCEQAAVERVRERLKQFPSSSALDIIRA